MTTLTARTTTGLNLRQHATTAAAILHALPEGATVTLLGNVGAWLYVLSGEQRGFAYSKFLAQQPAEAGTAWTTTVLSSELNMRDGPSPAANQIAVLHQGQAVEIQGFIGTWLLATVNGQSGFIKADYTQSVQAESGAPFDASQPASQLPARSGVAINALGQPSGTPSLPLTDGANKARLAPDEIRILRQHIAEEQDPTMRGDRYEELQSRVIYASQRDNQVEQNGSKVESKSGTMCNLTSLAMVLSYLGIANPNPQMQYEDALETLRQQQGLPARTTSAGWGAVARVLGAQPSIFAEGVTAGYDWWETHVRQPWLRTGCGVMMSIGEHIVRVQAVTPAGLVVDDPYGHCRLLPGEARAWSYDRVNQYATPNQTAGEDALWPWDNVAHHRMRWIASFAPNTGVLGGADDLPEVEDDGVVMEHIDV